MDFFIPVYKTGYSKFVFHKLGSGSGFFISNKGEIITNWHVISNASSAIVKTSNGAMFDIEGVVIKDEKKDLVKLKIKSTEIEFPFLNLTTEIPTKGEKIFVIGNPFGFEFTVSDGLISAIREIPDIGKVVQITAPISSGSSGSPIINLKGQVIGVASFQLIQGQNLNFSISAIEVAKLLNVTGESVKPLIPERIDTESSVKGIDKTEQEQIYLFTLDLVKSLTYVQEAQIGLICLTFEDETISCSMIGIKNKESLKAAINRIEFWRNNRIATIRRISEDLTKAIFDIITMQDELGDIFKICLPKSDFRNIYCPEKLKYYFNKKKDGEEGAYYKLVNKFTDIAEELPIIIIKYGVSKSKKIQNSTTFSDPDTDFFLSISSDVSFILSNEQLKEIYNYIAESQKNLSSIKENASFGDINITFLITNNLICSELSSKKFSFPAPCTLE